MRKIKVLIKEPGKRPYFAEINNDLRSLQKIVGGYIETVITIPEEGIVVVCNEEGRLMNLPKNAVFNGVDYVGTILFSGFDEEEFSDLPISVDEFAKRHPELFIEAEVES
jgi:hypothetical protein